MTSFFTAWDGAKIAFHDQGEGPVLLCLPGLTRNSSDFDYLVPHVSDFRVVRPDYRGRGASEWTGPETYTIQQEARDVIELLEDHARQAPPGVVEGLKVMTQQFQELAQVGLPEFGGKR